MSPCSRRRHGRPHPGDGVFAKVMPEVNCKAGHQLQACLMPKLPFCCAALQQGSVVLCWSRHPSRGLITVEGPPYTMGTPGLYRGWGDGGHRGQSKGH